MKPIKHFTLNFDIRDLHLANGNDLLYSSTGSVLAKTPSTGAHHRYVGREPDLLAKFDVRENISVGAGYDYLFAGRFLTENSAGDRVSIVYTFATYKF